MLAAMSSPADGGSTTLAADPEELRLIAGLRRGDEAAFMSLVRRYMPQMLRVARMYVASDAAAEDVVQETWIAVLNGIDRFEGRSSLRTWLFRILVNRARTRGTRDARTTPFSSLARDVEGDEPSVPEERFLDTTSRWRGHWASAPRPWGELPEEQLLASETLEVARRAIDALPEAQRTVVTLRDVDGWDSGEVARLLGISEGNQRVLLHRGRSKVRRALEEHLDG
jgi:RNA polymerase sigma-70 factor (ECF subfamily)